MCTHLRRYLKKDSKEDNSIQPIQKLKNLHRQSNFHIYMTNIRPTKAFENESLRNPVLHGIAHSQPPSSRISKSVGDRLCGAHGQGKSSQPLTKG